jgi:hypothetical protein
MLINGVDLKDNSRPANRESLLPRNPRPEQLGVRLGKPKADVNPAEWRKLFHTREEIENAPDPQYLIHRFLQEESITGLIGPARARKSIVTLNVIHALLTGQQLFGHFDVTNKPARVVYLCPESGMKTLAKRVRNMGLAKYMGESFFMTSMNSELVALEDPRLLEAARGSVLIIDTAIRFFDGDENSSQDMKAFGKQCQLLIREGVRAIFLLHHTVKNGETITLESSRGSGDFGGFLTCCWATTLDDYQDAYNTNSMVMGAKERDFKMSGFRLSPSGDEDNFFLQYVEGSEGAKVTVGAKAKVGKARAEAFVRANTHMTGEQLHTALMEMGIDYSLSSCRNMLRAAKVAAKPGATLAQQ